MALAGCDYNIDVDPYNSGGTVHGTGDADGDCGSASANLKRQRTGPDQVLSNTSRVGAGQLPLPHACDWVGSWGIYVEVYGSQDSTSYSSTNEIDC